MTPIWFNEALSALGGSLATLAIIYPFMRRADRETDELQETCALYKASTGDLLSRIRSLAKERDRLVQHNYELTDTTGRAVHARNDALKELAELKRKMANAFFQNERGHFKRWQPPESPTVHGHTRAEAEALLNAEDFK